MTTRTLISPSNLHRRKQCPGSARMEARVPLSIREKPSPESDEGTLLHKHVADKTLDRSKLTENQLWLVESAEQGIEEAVHAVMSAESISDTDDFDGKHEQSVTFYSEDGVMLFGGTADFYRYWPESRVLLVLDLKTGFLDQAPTAEHVQLACYAVCLASSHGKMLGVDKAFTGLVQPRKKRDERVTLAAYTANSLLEAQREIVRIYAATFDPEAPLQPSEDACRYCTAKLICDAYTDRYMTLDAYRAQSLVSLPHDQFEQVGLAIKFAAAIKDDWSAEALRRIDAGEMPGWKKKDNGSASEITDAKAAFSLLRDALPSMTADDFMEAVTLKIGAVRELAQKHVSISKQKAKSLVNAVLEPVLTITPKATSPIREK